MKKDTKQMYIMLIPAVAMFLVFVIWPFFDGAKLTFYNWNGYSQNMTFVGFNNYKSLISDSSFKKALINTLTYGIVCTLIQNIIGLVYALLVNQKFILKNTVRTFVYLPSIISGLVMGYMMYNIFQYSSGALNDIMLLLGLDKIDWLGEATRAKWIIIIINSIQFVGVAMLIYLAGLQRIPKNLIEASSLDGANQFQVFRQITFPLLIPAIRSSVIINLIGGLQLYGVIMALTNGGPGGATNSVSTLINVRYFNNEDAGGAAAIGLVLFFIVFVISYSANRFFNSKEVEL